MGDHGPPAVIPAKYFHEIHGAAVPASQEDAATKYSLLIKEYL